MRGWETLRHGDFARICGVRFANTLSNQIIQISIAWYVYDVTGDAFALAYLGLAGFLPAVVLVLFTGYAADHMDRRTTIAISASGFALTSVALLALIWSGSNLVWPVYVLILFISSCRSFFNTASRAIIPNLVPKEKLSSAVAFASGADQVAYISGPAIGGLLYAVSAELPFIVASATLALTTIVALLVRYRGVPQKKREPVSLKILTAGFSFMSNRQVILGAITLDALVGLLANINILLPIFAKDILQVGPEGLGILRSAPAVGALLMAAWLANNQFANRRAGIKLFISVAVFGVATVLFGVSESFVFSLLALMVVGAADMISVVIRHTLIQGDTPDELRGRVSSVNSLFTSASSELGRFRAGVVAGFLGAVPAAVIGGAAAIAITVIWPVVFRELRLRDHLLDKAESEKQV